MSIVQEDSKTCTECGIEKSLEAFAKAKYGRLGRAAKCKECKNAAGKKFYQETTIIPDPTITEKACAMCGNVFPLEEFTVNSRSKDGRGYRCKACRLQPKPDLPDGFKECTKCRILKPLEMFYPTKDGYLGVRGDCIECVNSRRQEIYEENKEELNRLRRIQYEENFDSIRKGLEAKKALKKNAQYDGHTDSDVFERWGELCYLCGVRVAIDGVRIKGLYEKDHVIPYALGGDNIIENVRPSCEACNGRKLAKPLLLFLYQRTRDQLFSGELVITDDDHDWYKAHCDELDLLVPAD